MQAIADNFRVTGRYVDNQWTRAAHASSLGGVEMVPRTVVAVVAVVTVVVTVTVIAVIFHRATDNSHHPVQRHHGKTITELPVAHWNNYAFYQHDHPLTK